MLASEFRMLRERNRRRRDSSDIDAIVELHVADIPPSQEHVQPDSESVGS